MQELEQLDTGAFHQTAYYMTQQIGRFVVMVFRGHEVQPKDYDHVKRISTEKQGGIVLLLTERDLLVFIRQAIKGKDREQHLQETYDKTVQMIS